MRILAITPTYNEIDNIRTLVPDLLKLDLGLEVLVVDDNSPDGTALVVKEFAKSNSRVHLIQRESKLGLGTAYIAAFKHAIAQGYDSVIHMDADYSHHPHFVPSLVGGLDRADVVIGSRYVPGGEVINCKWSRKRISRTANFIAQVALGWHVHDGTAGFRAYRIEVLKSIDLDSIFSSGYSFLVETLYRCHCKGFRILELPVTFKDRFAGQSKLSTSEIRLAMYTIGRLGIQRVLGRS